jgi:hypothetical protein
MDLINQISTAPLWVIAGALLLYLSRQLFEGRLKSEFTRMEKLFDSSLGLKTGLRSQEQEALLDFRLAVEKWEYSLQNCIDDVMTQVSLGAFDPDKFYKADQANFGKARAAAVKASVLLRNRQLEEELLDTISVARNLYYPLITKAINETIPINQQLAPITLKLTQFEASEFRDLSLAPTEADRDRQKELLEQMTAVMAEFCKALVVNYPPIAEQLYDLKDKINTHIYRPLQTHRVDEVVTG